MGGRYILLLVCLAGLSTMEVRGQDKFRLASWTWLDTGDRGERVSFRGEKDSLQVMEWLTEVREGYFDRGYIGFSVDSVFFKTDVVEVYAFLGRKYIIDEIVFSKDAEEFVSRKRRKPGSNLSEKSLTGLKNELLRNASSTGYPFAVVNFEALNLEDEEGRVKLRVNVEKNTLVYFSKVVLNEESPVRPSFVKSYLGIKKDGVFDSRIIEGAYGALDELPYLNVSPKSSVYFEDNQGVLDLFIDKRNASSFDILLGLLPQTDLSTGLQTFTLTGNMNIEMYNQLERGEYFAIHYRSPGNTSQELKVNAVYPYLLNLPFGVESHFELFRRDSSFSDLKFSLAVSYLFRGVNNLRVYFESDVSNILTINRNQIVNSGRLPVNLDYNYRQYGVGLHLEDLDYRYNPRSGWLADATVGIGNRRIIRNPVILEIEEEGFDAAALYDEIPERILKLNVLTELAYYIPLGRVTTFLVRNRTGLQIADIFNTGRSNALLVQNELFRIGGIYTLRGFDEDVYFSDMYSITTGELRLLTGRNSNLFAFGDYGFVSTLSSSQLTRAYGFGAGMNAETKVGIFSISYGLGGAGDAGPDFRNGKIHFGYLALF